MKQDQIHASIVSTLLALMDGLDARGQVTLLHIILNTSSHLMKPFSTSLKSIQHDMCIHKMMSPSIAFFDELPGYVILSLHVIGRGDRSNEQAGCYRPRTQEAGQI